jgi:hypothetical protein
LDSLCFFGQKWGHRSGQHQDSRYGHVLPIKIFKKEFEKTLKKRLTRLFWAVYTLTRWRSKKLFYFFEEKTLLHPVNIKAAIAKISNSMLPNLRLFFSIESSSI